VYVSFFFIYFKQLRKLEFKKKNKIKRNGFTSLISKKIRRGKRKLKKLKKVERPNVELFV